MRIELHIGRIVLEGTDPHDAPALRAAFESHLTTLLTRTPFTSAVSHRVLRAGAPSLPPTPTSTAFGQALAHAVHGILVGPTGGGR